MFTSQTEFELLIQFYEDVFEHSPLEAHRGEDGEIQFKDTGDDMIDLWEEKIAAGEEPNLADAFTPEALEKLRKRSARKKSTSSLAAAGSFKDAYESIERQAAREGLQFNQTGLPSRTGWSRTPMFGDDPE